MHQYRTLNDVVPFGFGANDGTGAGADGATPTFAVRLVGAAANAAPVQTGTPTLLTHASYTDGSYEIAITASVANGYAAGSSYLVFCSVAVNAVNPTGFVGAFSLAPVPANTIQISGTTQTARDVGLSVLLAANQHVITDSGTVTTLTNLPAAPADWLTAAAVKADAVTKIQNGLSTYAGGDTAGVTTLLARVPSAITLTAGAVTLIAAYDAAKTASQFNAATDGVMLTAGTGSALVAATAGQVTTDHGAGSYVRNTEPVDVSANVGAIKAKTDNLPASPAAVGSLMNLADGAITDAKITFPAESAGRPTTFLAAMRRVWEWVTNKRTRNRTTGDVVLRNAGDTATLETQTQTTVDPTDTQSKGA